MQNKQLNLLKLCVHYALKPRQAASHYSQDPHCLQQSLRIIESHWDKTGIGWRRIRAPPPPV